MEQVLRVHLRGLLTGSLIAVSAAMLPASANAQDAVIVDLGAIDANTPQLLVPGESGTPVKLRPPAGITPPAAGGAIKLRPPPSMVKRTMPAPTTETARKPREAASPKAPEVAKAAPAPAAKPKDSEVAKATSPPAAPKAPPPAARRGRPTPITPQAKQKEAEAAEPADVETAALVAPEKTPSPPDEFTIPYGTRDADVPERADDDLRLLAARMVKNSDLRVEFIAYASDPDESVSRSRRLSLERAVNVRKMLLDAGVDSSRVNLRALGEQSGNGDPDRIDVVVTTR